MSCFLCVSKSVSRRWFEERAERVSEVCVCGWISTENESAQLFHSSNITVSLLSCGERAKIFQSVFIVHTHTSPYTHLHITFSSYTCVCMQSAHLAMLIMTYMRALNCTRAAKNCAHHSFAEFSTHELTEKFIHFPENSIIFTFIYYYLHIYIKAGTRFCVFIQVFSYFFFSKIEDPCVATTENKICRVFDRRTHECISTWADLERNNLRKSPISISIGRWTSK